MTFGAKIIVKALVGIAIGEKAPWIRPSTALSESALTTIVMMTAG
jgi:hypothetical protein